MFILAGLPLAFLVLTVPMAAAVSAFLRDIQHIADSGNAASGEERRLAVNLIRALLPGGVGFLIAITASAGLQTRVVARQAA